MAEVCNALALSPLDISHFNGHSFRIGAATTAAQAGVPDSMIKMYGPWQSDAYLRYLQVPTSTLAEMATRISAQ